MCPIKKYTESVLRYRPARLIAFWSLNWTILDSMTEVSTEWSEAIWLDIILSFAMVGQIEEAKEWR